MKKIKKKEAPEKISDQSPKSNDNSDSENSELNPEEKTKHGELDENDDIDIDEELAKIDD